MSGRRDRTLERIYALAAWQGLDPEWRQHVLDTATITWRLGRDTADEGMERAQKAMIDLLRAFSEEQ